jgi:5-dehydro-2-deoxygluconokinase
MDGIPDDLQVLTMGRVSVDLYPEQVGATLAEVRTFRKDLGGSPTNVAVAAARLGRRSAVITRVGTDGFGLFVHEALRAFGVYDGWIGVDPTLRTPITFCEVHPPDHFPLLFYRQPKAPDMNVTEQDLDLEAIANVPLLWTTGTGLSDEPSRTATLAAMRSRTKGVAIHDLDYRPALWADVKDAPRLAREAIALSSVVVGNQDEVEMATGHSDPEAGAAALIELGVQLAVVKMGTRGVYAQRGDERVAVPPVQVKTLCGLGAGDAFGGALCHGLLGGWGLERTVRFANAAGAIVASRLTCASEMPYEHEVEALLKERDQVSA